MNSFRLFLKEKTDVDRVIDNTKEILNRYSLLSIADVKSLVGMPTTHVDHRRGWITLDDITVEQRLDSFLIIFPPAEVI